MEILIGAILFFVLLVLPNLGKHSRSRDSHPDDMIDGHDHDPNYGRLGERTLSGSGIGRRHVEQKQLS